jgi:tetratricopeptide (TPR) repeat protein
VWSVYIGNAATMGLMGAVFALALAVSLALPQQPAPPPAPTPPGDAVAQASADLDAGRYEQAIAALAGFVEKNPDNVPARFNLALAQSLAGHDEEAIAGFQKVLKLSPDLFEARVNLGQILVKAKRYAEAEPLLEKAVSQKESDPRPVYLLARALAGQEKWKEAVPHFARAAELSPDEPGIRLEYAEACERAGMKSEAIAAYRQAPDNPAARERLGLLLLDSGDNAGAIEQLESVMKTSPSPADAFALATAYLRLKQPERALPWAQLMVEKEPANLDARLFLGRLFRDQKRYVDAARQFEVVVRGRPDSLEAWNEYAGMLLVLEQYEPALAALEQSRRLGGETVAYFWFRAITLDALKQTRPALESYQRFLDLSQGKNPDEEFKARQRARILQRVLNK